MIRRDPQKHYQLSEEIGKGSFAKVYCATSLETKQRVAIKIVELANISDENLAQALNEIRILSSIKNPYIVNYIESFVLRNHSQLWIVMELLEGGDLCKLIEQNERLNKMPNEKQVWTFLIQALIGLRALHALKIIHRDLKPSNLYLSPDRQSLKIGDMNVSTLPQQAPANLIIGTPPYVAPEIWRQQPYTTNSDVFSLACLIYEYATLLLPFNGKNIDELKNQIMTCKTPKLPKKFSSDLQTILTKCFIKIPELRPSAQTLLDDPIIKAKIGSLKIDTDYIINYKLAPEIKIPDKRYYQKLLLPRRQASPVVNTTGMSKIIEEIYAKTMHAVPLRSPGISTKKSPSIHNISGNSFSYLNDKSSKTMLQVNEVSIGSNILLGKIKGYQPQNGISFRQPIAPSFSKKAPIFEKSLSKKVADTSILKKLTADTGIPNSELSFVSEILATTVKGKETSTQGKLKSAKGVTVNAKQPTNKLSALQKNPSILTNRSKVFSSKK